MEDNVKNPVFELASASELADIMQALIGGEDSNSPDGKGLSTDAETAIELMQDERWNHFADTCVALALRLSRSGMSDIDVARPSFLCAVSVGMRVAMSLVRQGKARVDSPESFTTHKVAEV